MPLPIPALADFLFGRTPKDQHRGVLIWTDRSRNPATPGSTFSKSGEDLKSPPPAIQVTPQYLQFVQRSRISEQVIKDGRAFFFWRKDRASSHLDLLEIRISGLSRGLMAEKPGASSITQLFKQEFDNLKSLVTTQATTTTGQPVPTAKQIAWLKFWLLTREPFLTEDGPNPNYHYLQLQTPALPIPVTFKGHFAGPVEWRHSAKNPFLVEWNLTLIVHKT